MCMCIVKTEILKTHFSISDISLLTLAFSSSRSLYTYIHIYTITIKIFTSHKKSLKKCLRPFNKENFQQLPSNLSERILFAFWKTRQFFNRVNIEMTQHEFDQTLLSLLVFVRFFINATAPSTMSPSLKKSAKYIGVRWKEFMIMPVHSCLWI